MVVQTWATTALSTAECVSPLVAGRLVRGDRRVRLRLASRRPWVRDILTALDRLQALPAILTSHHNRSYD
ncbi:hypothetical protein AB0G05_41955 [Nonomuraea wenchangensis]